MEWTDRRALSIGSELRSSFRSHALCGPGGRFPPKLGRGTSITEPVAYLEGAGFSIACQMAGACCRAILFTAPKLTVKGMGRSWGPAAQVNREEVPDVGLFLSIPHSPCVLVLGCQS